MFKNVATKIALFAFDTTTGAAKTGDAANLTAYVSKDYGAVTVLADTSATEMDATNAKGWYLFDVAQGEANADALLFTAKSSTANISVVGQYIFPTPNRFTTLVIDAAGLADANMVKAGPTGSGTAQTAGDIIGDTNDIQTRLPAALVSGRIDASVGAVANDAITAAAIATDAIGALELAAGAASEIATAVRTELTTELGRIDVAVSTRASQTSVDTVAGYVDTEVAAIKAKTDQLVFTVANQVDVNVVDWKGATAPAMTGDAFARLGAPAGASVSADVAAVKVDTAAIKAKTDNLPSDPADASDIAGAFGTVNSTLATIASYVDTEVAAIKVVTDKIDTTLEATSDGFAFTANALENSPSGSTPPTAAAIADAVWEEAIADHSGTSGSTAEALAAAGSAGDPWMTALPGGYSAGQAGFIVGTNLDAAISTRATQASVDDLPTNAELATALGTADDAVLAAIASLPTAVQNADALLNRDMATGTDSGSDTVRTPRQALRILRNRWFIDTDGVQTINKEDDTTPSWTQQLSTDAAATPVTGTDPAGP